jgi:phosphoglycerate dehydrogenase-like enzyme
MKVVLAWNAKPWELKIFEGKLRGLARVVPASGSKLVEEIADAEVVVGRPPDEAVLAARRLRFIQAPWAGVDGFNLQLLRSKGVVLASAKGCNARAVAEHALALMLALAKRVVLLSEHVKAAGWVPWSEETFLDDLEGKTVVILGYGNIGQELARICKCLGMRVIGVRRRPAGHDEYAERVVGLSELKEVVGFADYLVVILPLTPETRGVVGRHVLKAMKPTAYLVNVGRGAVVDEEALYEALTKGWIAGAALDVWWSYPPDPRAPSKLGVHKLPNVVATPHKAGWTREARRRCLEFAAENVARYLKGEEPLNVVDYDNPY